MTKLERTDSLCRAIRDAVNELFSDQMAHTLREVEAAAKTVKLFQEKLNEYNKPTGNVISVPTRTGFGTYCVQELAKHAFELANAQKVMVTKKMSKWSNHKGRFPDFYVIKINPAAKDKQKPRQCTTAQIMNAYMESDKYYEELKNIEQKDKNAAFAEVSANNEVSVILPYERFKDGMDILKEAVKKEELQRYMPKGITPGLYALPKIKSAGDYTTTVRYSRDKSFDLTIHVIKAEPEAPKFIPLEEYSMPDLIQALRKVASKYGLECEITLK